MKQTFLLIGVTKMKPYISANRCNYTLVSGTVLSLCYTTVAFF